MSLAQLAPEMFKKVCEIVTASLQGTGTITAIEYPKYVRGGAHGTRYEMVVHTTSGQQTVKLDHSSTTGGLTEGYGD
jgi:hypothetical protein